MSFSNFNIGKNAQDYETSEVFDSYARVDVVMGEDDEGNVITVSYPSSDADDGRVLTVQMPMCTDSALALTAATRIYNSLMTKDTTAFQYQPMKAQSALLDPSAEFGDSVDVNSVHSGFHTRNVNFSQLMQADITSPTDEELNHEYPYQDSQQRQITRTAKDYKAGLYVNAQAISAEVTARTEQGQQFESQLSVQATQIAAKVSATGGNNSTFGWTLTSSGHTWYSGNKTVMKVTSSGLEVTGKITATSGQIGGFTIGSNSIYSNGMSSMSSTQSTGVHVGTDGIKLGQKFSVNTSGDVTAKKLTIDTLVIGGTNVSASTLNSRANSAYTSTSSGGYCYNGATAGNSAQSTWNAAQNPSAGINYMKVNTLVVPNAMTLQGHGVGAYTATISGVTIPYFGWGAPY